MFYLDYDENGEIVTVAVVKGCLGKESLGKESVLNFSRDENNEVISISYKVNEEWKTINKDDVLTEVPIIEIK